jgi:Cu/Ag efflux protein CusF
MTGLAFAQEKAKPGKSAEVAKPEGTKPEKAKKETSAKPEKYRMGGIVTAIDAAARKITIKQSKVKREKIVILTMSKKTAKELSKLKVGDLVNVGVRGKIITDLKKVD